MRDIDRIRRRKRWRQRSDRAVLAMVAVLAVVATVTVLPQGTQQRLISLGCSAATLGLTDCVARLYEPPTQALRAIPLCEVDQVLERIVPTVERQTISFAGGNQLERWVGREGTIRVIALPEEAAGGPIDPWTTTEWPMVELLSGVNLPLSAQWTFPNGEGEREFVAQVQREHALQYQERSALSPFLPGAGTTSAAASATSWVATGAVTIAPEAAAGTGLAQTQSGEVRLEGPHAQLLHDTTTGTAYTTVGSSGVSPDGTPVSGVVRWGRADTGEIVELVGSWAWEQQGSTRAVHLYLPLAPGDQTTVEAWLSTAGGPRLNLAFLQGEQDTARDGIERLISAAGIVAIEDRGIASEELISILSTQVALDRRPYGELAGPRSSTKILRPQPSGADRTPQEVLC